MTTTWNIDSAHSGIHFTVRHMVFAKVRGRFATWRGASPSQWRIMRKAADSS